MKKILLVLVSILCVLTSPMSLFADELSDFEKIAQGKGGQYEVGQIIELPIDIENDDDSAIERTAKFLVIGKNEGYQNTLTFMSLEPLTLFDENKNNILYDGELTSIQNNLKEGTYTGTVNINNLVGYKEGMFFTVKDKNTDLDLTNSTIKRFSNYVEEAISSLDDDHLAFVNRILEAKKDYVLEDGTTATITSKFWLPSLKELGFNAEIGNTEAYSLFTSKNIMTYLNEKDLDTDKKLQMFTRDVDYKNNGVYVIDHANVNGYKLETNKYATYNFGVCFIVTYDENITEYKNPTGDNNVLLYANKPSVYYVLMPKKVYIHSEQTTPFDLIVYGEIETSKFVNIKMPNTVSLVNNNGTRTPIELTIEGTKHSINSALIDDGKKVVKVINVTAPKIYAGSWEVNLPITISLDSKVLD